MIQDPQQSAFGLAPNVAAGLASLFGWVGGLVVLLGKPPQPWVRFVAVESIVLSVAYIILWIAIGVVNAMLGVAHLWALIPIIGLVGVVAGIAYFIGWLLMTIKAFQGQAMRLPLVADWADRYVPASSNL